MPAKAVMEGDVVVVEGEEAVELFNSGWFGNLEDKKIVLSLIEAFFLLERGRIEIFDGKKWLSIKEFQALCNSKQNDFMFRYAVYRDIRERGLVARIGFSGTDFRVYERGAKPSKAETKIKWVVFCSGEEYDCELERLGNAIRLSHNIRCTALWAVVDSDLDVTYYIINEITP